MKTTTHKHLVNLPKDICQNSKTFLFSIFFSRHARKCYAFNKDLACFQAHLFVKVELKAEALEVVRKTA